MGLGWGRRGGVGGGAGGGGTQCVGVWHTGVITHTRQQQATHQQAGKKTKVGGRYGVWGKAGRQVGWGQCGGGGNRGWGCGSVGNCPRPAVSNNGPQTVQHAIVVLVQRTGKNHRQPACGTSVCRCCSRWQHECRRIWEGGEGRHVGCKPEPNEPRRCTRR